MRSFLKTFFLALGLALGGVATRQPPRDARTPFSVEIKTLNEAVHSGAKLKVRAEVTNTSRHALMCGEGCEINFEIRGPGGAQIPLKQSYIEEWHRAHRVVLALVATRIEPGGTNKWDFVLTDMYDLSQPGQYVVRAQRKSLDDPHTVATSNTLTITVVPSEAEARQTTETSTTAFSLEIDLYQDVVKPGSRVLLLIMATNKTQHDIRFVNGQITYSFDVRDSRGATAALTKVGRSEQSLHQNFHSTPSESAVLLRRGETMCVGGVSLAQLYTLKRPGQYTIQVSRTDEETETLVTSNVIALTVRR